MIKIIHVTDLQAWGGQRTITAVCGKRVSVNRVLRSQELFADLPTDRVTPAPGHHAELACVGCRAVLIERRREYERAGLQ